MKGYISPPRNWGVFAQIQMISHCRSAFCRICFLLTWNWGNSHQSTELCLPKMVFLGFTSCAVSSVPVAHLSIGFPPGFSVGQIDWTWSRADAARGGRGALGPGVNSSFGSTKGEKRLWGGNGCTSGGLITTLSPKQPVPVCLGPSPLRGAPLGNSSLSKRGRPLPWPTSMALHSHASMPG